MSIALVCECSKHAQKNASALQLDVRVANHLVAERRLGGRRLQKSDLMIDKQGLLKKFQIITWD